jgi:hypothetical protein
MRLTDARESRHSVWPMSADIGGSDYVCGVVLLSAEFAELPAGSLALTQTVYCLPFVSPLRVQLTKVVSHP